MKNDAFPLTFDVERPPVFRRAHVVLRFVLLILVDDHPPFTLETGSVSSAAPAS